MTQMRDSNHNVNTAIETENFVNQFYTAYLELNSYEKKLLLINLQVVLRRVRADFSLAEVSSLSSRELEVLVLVSHGYCRKEISRSLCISVNTAARHIANIYSKLGVNTVAEATQIAIASNLTIAPISESDDINCCGNGTGHSEYLKQ